MPKKTTILIIILAVITGILIFVAVRTDQTQEKKLTTPATPTPVIIKPYAALSFSTPLLDASKGLASQKVNIILDTQGKSVAGAQVELTYDPKVLTNVSLTPLVPDQLFGPNPILLINNIDVAQGRISYALSISANDTEKTGKASIGQLSFTVNRFAGVASTSITFLPKSAVTTQKTKFSVLSSTTPLQIQVAPAAKPTQ